MKRWIVVAAVVALAGCKPQPEPQYYAAQQPAYGGQAPGQQGPGQPPPYVAAQPNAQPPPAGSLQPQDPYAASQPATRQPSQPASWQPSQSTAPQPPSAPQAPVAQQAPAQPAPGEIQWYGKPPPAVLPHVKTPPAPRTAQTPAAPTPGTQRPPTVQQPAPPRPRKVDTRRFTFNGRAATQTDLETLSLIEAMYGQPVPQGDYWYDALSGAAGAWSGPTLGFLPAGLQLGGPLPANASGGGKGRLTGVFVNGRELHPIDVQVLTNLYGQVLPGRWWVDGQGNAGQEGGPPLLNLVVVARQRAAAGKGKGAESYYRSDGRGNNAFVGGGCVSTSTTTGSGDSKKTYDYYSAGC